jgi:exopolysaccharide production protein ExoZ
MSVQNSKNVAALQILRAIAAILIVIWHSHLAIKYASANYWIEGNAQYRAAHYPSVLNHLDIGVDIFFCISGFIMALLIYKAAPSATASLTFLIRRALRILPPYWFFSCLVVVAFVMSAGKFNVGKLSGHVGADSYLFIKSLLFIPQPDGPVLGVGWTLIHESLFYYVCAIAIALRLNRRLAELLFLLSAIAVGLSCLNVQWLYGYGLSTFYIDFFFGALAFRVCDTVSKIAWPLQLGLAVAGYVAFSWILDSGLSEPLYSIVRPVGSGLIALLLVTGLIGADRKFSITTTVVGAMLMRIGDASYSLYLVHWFVLSIMGKVISVAPHVPLAALALWHVLSILAAIIVAVVFAEKIELPFHRYLVSRFDRMSGSASKRPTLTSTS